MSAPDYGSPVFAALRQATPDWQPFTRHPFVEGLATGTLPRTAFLHYLRQDYVFLIHFSRAWALGVAKAATLEEMRFCAGVVSALLDHEMRLHVETCAAAGIPAADLERTAEAPANLAYTRYVLEAGYSGDFLDLLAALAPCVLGYGEIGARLAREATDQTYADWIATYAGEDCQATCTAVGELLENAVATRLGPDPAASPRWPALLRRFRTATRLELDFWDMGLTPD